MKRFISILLSFCILALQLGCYSTKTLTMDKASKKNELNNSLVLHTPGNVYKVHNYRFKDGMLTGQLRKYTKPWKKTIHVFTQKEFQMEPYQKSGPFITLERSDIEKITYLKHTTRSPMIIAGGILFIFIMLAIEPDKYPETFF